MTSILTSARPPADRQNALEWSEGKHFSKPSLDSPPRTPAGWSAWSLPKQKNGWLKCCFTSAETVGLLGTGAQDVHLDFHTAPELCKSVSRSKDYVYAVLNKNWFCLMAVCAHLCRYLCVYMFSQFRDQRTMSGLE